MRLTVPSKEPIRRDPEPRRHVGKKALIVLGIFIFLLFAIVFSQAAFNLNPLLRPESPEQTFVFAALSALIFLLLVTLTFILLRNLVKLFAERRLGVLGSKFRTRMVVGALALSFTPVIFLFLFAYGLMNRSIDKWFSRPVEELREDTAQVGDLLSRYAADNARAEAASVAAAPETRRAFDTGNFAAVVDEFRRRERTLQGGFAVALLDDDAVASFHLPQAWGFLRSRLPSTAEVQKGQASTFRLDDQEYMLGAARVGNSGAILVAMPLPPQFTATLARVEASQKRYLELAAQRKLVRRTYMGLLLLLTVLVLFAATWFALFLSKLVTRPVTALAAATQEISRGRLDTRVEVPAADELGDLVQSFNRMAEEMESSRRQIEASSRELGDANVALEQRRQHMETILESIPTSVLSVDAERRVTRANHAFARMFAPQGAATLPGAPLRSLLHSDVVDDLEHLMRKADRMGAATSQMEIPTPGARLQAAVTVASLAHEGKRLGYVIVIEDLSDLLKAQKQAAWRDVARRVAHEIKNPLTPIALSAERIRRHLERGSTPDAASLNIIRGCADTIGGAVETVRTLVDEFSALARFPASKPEPADVNAVVESALAMFDGRLENIRVETHLATGLPAVRLDAEAMKRAVANLVDNAAEAVQGSLLREVHISTAMLEGREAVEIVVADTGQGVTPDVKERLFLPYFSTKKRGTGLGLAIVSRIIEEHQGSIRVEENAPVGARFIVELPVAAEERVPEPEAQHV